MNKVIVHCSTVDEAKEIANRYAGSKNPEYWVYFYCMWYTTETCYLINLDNEAIKEFGSCDMYNRDHEYIVEYKDFKARYSIE